MQNDSLAANRVCVSRHGHVKLDQRAEADIIFTISA